MRLQTRLKTRLLRLPIALILMGLAIAVTPAVPGAPAAESEDPCLACHGALTPGIVGDWEASLHAREDVTCADCHIAEGKDRPDIQDHYGHEVVVLVTPKDCASCHPEESQEFQESHHARAAQFIGSLDNVLGEIVGGPPVANVGCRQCHGSVVKVLEDGKLDPTTWPNTGIGRVNPDGSAGSCSACHARHGFSVAQVRQPENCGKCHMGVDHPQIEVYNESKHGILYHASKDRMNLDRPGGEWLPGRDYLYPTCTSCHMGATKTQPATHDVGERISWTLRPPISTKLDNADARRANMQDVCKNCHSAGYVSNFYQQYDDLVVLYNEKFAIPATEVMKELRAEGVITPTPFDDEIEWTYFQLWHHEGRRARHGASMSGPDYAWWHGLYEVANNFYNDFLPEAEHLRPGISDPILESEHHRWRKGLTDEEIQQVLGFYKERYGQ
jgi:hydroxylamine dehydrogenase